MKKRLSLLLAFVCLFSTICFPVSAELSAIKIPADGPDFIPGQVVVYLDKSCNDRISDFTQDDFPGVSIARISYAMEPHKLESSPLANVNGLRYILLLELTVRTKQAVRDAVEVLQTNPIVVAAEPNYLFEYAVMPDGAGEPLPLADEPDFVEGHVIVSLDRSCNDRISDFTPDDFPGVSIAGISYAMEPHKLESSPLANVSKLRYILLLELTAHTKQAVRDAVEVLQTNPIVVAAEPDYLYQYAVMPDQQEEINEYQWWLISHGKTEEEQQQLLQEEWVQQRLQPEEKVIGDVRVCAGVAYYQVTMKQNANRQTMTPEALHLPYAQVDSLYAPYNPDRLYACVNAQSFHATYLVTVEEDESGFAYQRLLENPNVLSVEIYHGYTDYPWIFPDIDGDRSITPVDALYVLQYAVGKVLVTNYQMRNADLNGNRMYDAGDALAILKWAVGPDATFDMDVTPTNAIPFTHPVW